MTSTLGWQRMWRLWVYLMLQNAMLHDLFPSVVTIGEDVSGHAHILQVQPLFQITQHALQSLAAGLIVRAQQG